MKISVNWLKQFTDIDLSVDELVKKIGAQLGAVEEVIDLGQKYKGIVVAKVVSCEKHPNADKLSVCLLDDGGTTPDVNRDENGHVQVVCGAPNVREGLTVAWLPPGSVVPSTLDKDPFTLGARELRGVVSNGMIASAQELAIGDDHNGIVELDALAEPGTLFADAYELNDYIIDIENKMFTHRPDCFGILGVAREIAGIQNLPFKSPEWYLKSLDRVRPGKSKLALEVRNDAGALVPRFMAVAMADAQMSQSPFIIQTYLSRVGLKPINNIVDVTNYLMFLTGQPAHAYDADKLRSVGGTGDIVKLESRMSRKGDKIKLLSGKDLELLDESTVLITSNDVPVGVGGVMGGADTEVDENTKNIVVECASFDMYSIRKTSMKYGLFTDAVTRFNKGQSPLQNHIVLEEAVATMQYVSGAHVASEVFDLKNKVQKTVDDEIKVSSEFINVRLGLDLPVEDMARLLTNVEFEVSAHGDELSVTPPFWRTDIDIAEDIVEEVGRLYGFDHLPVELPVRSIKPAQKDTMLELKSQIRSVLAKAGANEVLTYSFVHGNLLDKVGHSQDEAFKLGNALSPDLQYYRMSLTPSLLEKVHQNVKAGHGRFAIFEIGKSHIKGFMDRAEESVPMEFNSLSLVFSADVKEAKAYKGAAFYQAAKYLDTVLSSLGVSDITLEVLDTEVSQNSPIAVVSSPFEHSRSALIKSGDRTVGIVGEFKGSVTKSLKLPEYSAGFEIGLLALADNKPNKYKPLSRFPKVEQDISLKVSKAQPYQPVFDELQNSLRELIDEGFRTGLTPLDIYQKGDAKHFTFRLSVAHYAKTLKASEINELLDKLADRLHQKLGAERI